MTGSGTHGPSAVATQTDQETASSITTFVTPGRQHFHPSAPKAWGYIALSGGTPSMSTLRYNWSSVIDSGVGLFSINFTTALSSAGLTVAVAGQPSVGITGNDNDYSLSSGSQVSFRHIENGAFTDPVVESVIVWGDI